MHQLGGGEAVVQLDQVDVCRADARLLVGRAAAMRVTVLKSGMTWRACPTDRW